MRVTEVSATVRYSAEAKGAWRSIEVGATATLTNNDETLETSQQELYARLSRQLKTLWANGSGTAPQDAPEGHQVPVQASNPHNSPGGGQLVPAHFCSEHNQEFKKRTGQYGEFWSHQIKGTRNQWCNEAKK
jgi:hypothetical protein